MNELSLRQLVRMLLTGWLRITVIGVVGAAIFVVVALLSDKVYESNVVLFPKKSSASSGLMSQLGQFGGITGLMGLNLGGSTGIRDESLAVLRSRSFVSEFIKRNDLLPQLSRAGASPFRSYSGKNMELQDAIEYFESKVRVIYDDKKLGIVRITIRWHDPLVGANLANGMATQLNREVRERDILEATTNVKYLQSELEKSQLVSLSEAIGTLLEGEIKRLMIARGNEEYVFRILDPAQPATGPVWPRPVFMCALGGLIGGVLACLSLILPSIMRSEERDKKSDRST